MINIMNKKSIAVILVVGLVAAGVLAYVYFNKGLKTADTGAVQAPETESSVAPATSGGVKAPITNNVVTIENFAFKPAVLEIKTGQKVVWKQNDAAMHTLVSVNNFFTSGTLRKGDEFGLVFNNAGEYDYRCGIHPSMTGKIIVK